MIDENQYVSKQVKSILFGMLSPKVVKKMAAAKVVTPELYDREGYPVDGGLMDIRLGVIDPGLKCKTCGSKLKECLGHFGYLELARPIVHYEYVPLVLTALRTTCRDCGKLLIPKSRLDKHIEELTTSEKEMGLDEKRKRIKALITELKTTNKCPHCKAKQFKITLEKPTTFLENEKRISPIEVRTRLEKISDEDALALGMNPKVMRPEWMVLTVLLIPPVTMRPSITLETGERSEDDLTHKLGDIVRINQRLFENINAGAPEIIIEDLWDLLQYHITTYFDNNVAQLPPARHRSGQPLKTISERIKAKEGRIRYNLAGKRTNFSARTVISPDPMLKINEVGVPEIVARKLTVPEKVNAWNSDYLKKYVTKGPQEYPGANYIIRPDGKKKRITDETKEQLLEEIQPGYVVERHLLDGDVVIFNRQPSLHKMSMMCHKVRVLPYKTFRLNPAVCAPYNADFDGDEMNLHVPQTEEARAEATILMTVQTQIISPRYGLAVIGGIQDAISGNYALTKTPELERKDAIRLLISAGIENLDKLANKTKISGKEVFSVLLPNDFNFKGEAKDGSPVVIKNGLLIEGHMDKANLGEGSGLLLRHLHKRYGEEFVVDFLEKVFRLGIETHKKIGFTVAISHLDLPKEAKDKIDELFRNAYKEIDGLIQLFEEDKLEAFPGKTIKDTLELKILEILNGARNRCNKIISQCSMKSNDLLESMKSGARGKMLNLTQMSACVGQQALRGKRINKGYKKRTLPHFKRDDLSPKGHGFIRDGYSVGLHPAEFFFGCITGRDALMDTALRTPKSGYLYRRLANAMQDLRAEYDRTVRDSSKKIVQFEYGEDGIDVSKSEEGKINVQQIINEVAHGKE